MWCLFLNFRSELLKMAGHRDEDSDFDKIKGDAKNAVSKIVDGISKSSSTKQLIIGSASGW